jgi:hypothetical protein
MNTGEIACAVCGRSFTTVAARSGHMPTHRSGRKGGLRVDDRCPGTGIGMVSTTYEIRKLEPSDRADLDWRARRAEARGDHEEAAGYRESILEWEKEQGQERERLVCAVCRSPWLKPTAAGTARPHRRDDIAQPSWGNVRQLRKEIQILQAELDRVLDKLEP